VTWLRIWVFKGDPPLSFRVVFYVAFAFIVVFWVTGITTPWWAPQIAAPSHPYGVRFKGGTTYYFPAMLGWLMQYGLWVFFALLATLALITWLHRDDLQRVR
jgi:hypothetical protein